MSEEQKNERAQEFLTKYKALVDEMQIDLATYPVFVPDGQGGFKVIVQTTPVDITNQPNQPKKSPFVADAQAS